jgi:MFS family permease
MQPITREIIDRRHPTVRWSAIFAGTAVAVGLWILLQIFGMGAGLAAVDTDRLGSLRGVSIGTTVWSLLAPLIAMFIGGFVAGKLADTRDDRMGMLHGVIVWALTSVLGVLACVSLVGALASGVAHSHAVIYDGSVNSNDAEYAVRSAADATGKALLAAGTSLLLSLGTALLGGLLSVRKFERGDRGRRREEHTTVQTPVVPPPAGVDTAAY